MKELRRILKEMGVQEKRCGTVFDFYIDTFSVTVHQYSGKLYELETKSGASSDESPQWSLVDRDTVIAYFEEALDSNRMKGE